MMLFDPYRHGSDFTKTEKLAMVFIAFILLGGSFYVAQLYASILRHFVRFHEDVSMIGIPGFGNLCFLAAIWLASREEERENSTAWGPLVLGIVMYVGFTVWALMN